MDFEITYMSEKVSEELSYQTLVNYNKNIDYIIIKEVNSDVWINQ